MDKPKKTSTNSESPRTPRPFIGMHFACCHVYARVYLVERDSVFRGRCPRCGKAVEIKAAKGGSKSRFWQAG